MSTGRGPAQPAGVPVGLAVVRFDAPGLGDRTYLIHDGTVAVVVDPQRDPRPYLETAAGLGVRITHVLETHIHNDYVSGGRVLARRAAATYVVPSGEQVAYAAERLAIGDRDQILSGTMRVQALATPGHTPHHLAYLVESMAEHTDTPAYVCTGGSLLAGGSGRTDLLGEALTMPLARAQWASLRRLLALGEATVVLPTHGFGSFCSSAPSAGTGEAPVTIGAERAGNPAALLDVEEFALSVTEDPPPIPLYYRHMGIINRAGALEVPDTPVEMAAASAVEEEIERGGHVVDLRPRREYAARHRTGTLAMELGENLATYLGWLVPFDAPLTLVARSSGEIAEARHLLAMIGREQITAWVPEIDLLGGARQGLGSYPVATFADLADASISGRPEVLDVRHQSEWRSGHVRGATHVPLPDLLALRGELPDDRPLWVHCAGGFRASVAASMLAAVDRRPVLVDDVFTNAALAGLVIDVDGPPRDGSSARDDAR